jgi:hypothetical protein
LVEAPNKDKKPDIKKLTKMLSDAKDMQTRNKQITKVCEQGYSRTAC